MAQGKLVSQQPQTVTMVAELPTQEWQKSLFSCFDDIGNCLYGLFCGKCAAATARSNFDGSNWCFNCCCIDSSATLRNIIREGYHIRGGCCSDILLGACCGPCVICQSLNEVQARGKVQLQWGANRSATPVPWNKGVFSCFDNCSNCMYAYCCPKCAMASARSKFDGSDWCFNCCCVSATLTRNVVREGYNIEGNCCSDILCTAACPWCVAAQLLNEVESRGKVTMQVVTVAR